MTKEKKRKRSSNPASLAAGGSTSSCGSASTSMDILSTAMANLRLLVYVIGLGPCSFSVNIESSKTVDELKKAILNEIPNLKGVDAHQLTLYKVEMPDGKNLEELALQAQKEELEVSSCTLFEVFPVKPPAKTVSILLDIKDFDDESSMEIDKEATYQSTPPRPTRQQTSHHPKNAIQQAFAKFSLLEAYILDGSNDDIKEILDSIYTSAQLALSQDPKLRHRLANRVEYRANINFIGENHVVELLRKTAKEKTWETLLNHSVFLKREAGYLPLPQEVHKSQNATVKAWGSKFKGNAADVLLHTISDYLDPTREVYGRFTSIINSSGTGKSRMVDELSTEIITIPMCLRLTNLGFPPPDIKIRDWLTGTRDKNEIAKRLNAFVFSLLNVTRERLTAIGGQTDDIDIFDLKASQEETEASVVSRQAMLASRFRDRMTEGQLFETTNQYRLELYNDVINEAERSLGCCVVEQDSSPPRYLFKGKNETDVVGAGEALCNIIDQSGRLSVSTGPRRPLIIISFDESHMLTAGVGEGKQTLFYELRCILRRLNKLPIFALFLSTSGYFHQFSQISSDPSNRISSLQYPILYPISETSFDDIAFRPTEGHLSLSDVVTMNWISHIGRPLFGTRYAALKVDDDLESFAKGKLLNGRFDLLNKELPKEGIMACLSVRFALEFNIDRAGSEVACTQVERHMRLCLGPTRGLERLITISADRQDPARHLATHVDLNCIDLGKRGEMVAALIIMQARDKAARDHQRRWISIDEFMAALLPTGAYQDLRQCKPVLWCPEEEKTFQETFEDYCMWFNHVIKVEDARVISVNKLWKFITRGAMVVCDRTQEGVDIILPICHKTEKLSHTTVTAILVQVKNNVKYIDHISPVLLNNMDPFELGLFDKNGSPPLPVIRIVFSLASQTSAVRFPGHPSRHRLDEFTAFDIWCAGLSKDVFQPIGDNVDSYKVLLDRSPHPQDAFNLQDMPTPIDESTKTLRENRRRRMAALATSLEGHDPSLDIQ
ncbi:hypothetical protein APHAL10511_007560 [Amanita phalloides]|nr:hypothetical protein APHAL10511_007560 [Amanita phalloides]